MDILKGLSKPLYEAPKLVIVRQPKKRGYRFRYRSEGETHGGIPGEPDRKGSSGGSKKFYPTIKILGHHGPAKVVVTLVSSNEPFHLHAHSMIVNREPMKGYCIFEMDGNSNLLELKNIAIQHAVKDKLTETLMDRILQDRFVKQFGWNSAFKVGEVVQDIEFYTSILEDRVGDSQFLDRSTAKAVAGHELSQLKKKAVELGKSMAMNSCRLCFQAFLRDSNGKYTQVLDRVFSDEIIDGKTKEGATLKIIRLSAVVSSVTGGDEVWLLADKLNADDVEVRFFKQDKKSGKLEWESFGDFSKSDVYKQAVLIFRTPKYKDQNIDQPVKVSLQLRRKKDSHCTSAPIDFTYKPRSFDRYSIGEKRRKTIPNEFIDAFPTSSNAKIELAPIVKNLSYYKQQQYQPQQQLQQPQQQPSLFNNQDATQQSILSSGASVSADGNLDFSLITTTATSNTATGLLDQQAGLINFEGLFSFGLNSQQSLDNFSESFLNNILDSDNKMETQEEPVESTSINIEDSITDSIFQQQQQVTQPFNALYKHSTLR